MEAKSKKTVFFLGAGFSTPAGIPAQSKLLEEAISLSQDSPHTEKHKNFIKFLSDGFSREKDSLNSMSLEDFFSPLDRCIAENASFRGYPKEDIVKYRDLMANLISEVINVSIKKEKTDYIRSFVRKVRELTEMAIITSNWDNLIESSFYDMNKETGVIDYGIFATGLGKRPIDQLIPALVAATKGYNTFKLYKIHGSIDWFICPVCDRLFISKYGLAEEINCRFCEEMFTNRVVESESDIVLNRSLIMPTFLKEFNNFHYKSLWYNFHRELSEAGKLVIIGYSLPAADHEIRQAFLRFAPDDCVIKVVGFIKVEDEKEAFRTNYKNLFGKRELTFDFDGVEKYIDTL